MKMHDEVKIKTDTAEAKAGTIGHIVIMEPGFDSVMIEIDPADMLTDDLPVFEIKLDNLELVSKFSYTSAA